jgi:ABC-type transport system involved in cytochrome bd biosynthesis fused ATPase/permease subunit
MLGYNPFTVKLAALVLACLYAGAAGAAYALLFGYAGANFATIQYSILPMLYVLLGGAGTTIGPFLGALLMFASDRGTSRLARLWPVLEGHYFLIGTALVCAGPFCATGHPWHLAGKGAEMAALIETRDLTLHFGGLRAVDGVDFTLNAGEVHALIGPNGAGKTTFVSLLSGRRLPQSGVILLDGEDITRLPAHPGSARASPIRSRSPRSFRA